MAPSLSASIQAIVAAEVGHIDLAYEYLRETAFVDLWDLAGNTDDGVHLAAMAGAALAAVAGFGGMRDHGDTLTFAPRLPGALTRLSFGMSYRDRLIRVTFDAGETRYELRAGDPVELIHHGETFELGEEAQTFPNPAAPDVSPVQPPPSRLTVSVLRCRA